MNNTATKSQEKFEIGDLESALAKVVDTPRDGQDERGAFYTRREVVDFILDLAGYVANENLAKARLLEPSFGNGDFLLPIVDRLVESWKRHHGKKAPKLRDLREALYAVELHAETFEKTQANLASHLETLGLTREDSKALCTAWLHRGDFLLHPIQTDFNFVVGNPPYVRQELIPQELMAEYRRRYATVYDRADLYVPFLERSLSLLNENGVVAFICSDRWTKNRYGGPLRDLVSQHYHLRYFVDMVDTDAFHSDVIAYPGIFVIAKERGAHTRIARRPDISAPALSLLTRQMRDPQKPTASNVRDVTNVASGKEPWILDSIDRLEVVRRIEAAYPLLEETGCTVRIGVATGADKVFVGNFNDLDVESSRKLPLVMTRDIVTGEVKWRGFGVINPFDDNGRLVSLADYPRLARYFEEHGKAIRDRHVASKNPTGWYRTIDRIYPELAKVPKLLIPDIKGEAHVVYENGELYPHHNLYYITSSVWDLHALQAVLLSNVTRAFISTYSTKMRGGYLRYQAQYLRRIRLPQWEQVTPKLRASLIRAAKAKNVSDCDDAVRTLYGITKTESLLLQEQ